LTNSCKYLILITHLITGLLSVITSGALVIVGSKYLAAGIPIAMVVVYFLQKFYLRTSRQLRLLDLQAKAPLYAHLVESGEGLATIRAFGWQKAVQADAMRLLDRSQRAHYLFFCIQRWLTFVLDMLVAVAAVVLVALAVVANASSAGGVAIAMSNMLGFSGTLASFITSWTQLETSLGAISRLKAFESTTPQETEKLGACDPPPPWPSSGQVTLQNMAASYTMTQGYSSSSAASIPDDQLVLRNLSLTIPAGQKIAICGRTGSGKSSLLLTFFRLLAHTGTSTIDGIDTTLIPHDTLRARLIAVPQEPVLFPGSIRSNLSPESVTQEPPSDAQLSATLERVNLLAAVQNAGGLDVDVAEVPLSHGQKQLLCLARAVLRKDVGRVLILDEAMSSVDEETEDLMTKVVEEEFAQHTVISVVHRMRTVRAFDRVVTLDRGSIVSDGPPSNSLT
jgi:ABC-type multidrug transport system fused ATPase/permease subunit